MPTDITLRSTRRTDEPGMQSLLGKLQGNILSGHGRKHSRYLFLTFKAGATQNEIRQALIPLLVPLVKSERDEQALEGPPSEWFVFANFLLSARGYERLGFSRAQIERFLPEEDFAWNLQCRFRDGMREHWKELHDPDPSRWESTYQAEIHALLVLAHESEDVVREQDESFSAAVSDIVSRIGREKGEALRNPQGQGIEHFGFVDGISQPVFFEHQLRGSRDKWNPVEPMSMVLVRDNVVPDAEAFGSFFVFRKLEQNVRRFIEREAELADELGLQGDDRNRVGAMALGRFRDGTPLVQSATAQGPNEAFNDFRYTNGDQRGKDRTKCPLHAHIRKVNPRGDIAVDLGRPAEEAEILSERRRRIVRRGVPYGTRAKQPWEPQTLAELPTDKVGLLFGCFQASIRAQFSVVQARWIGPSDHPTDNSGSDPVVGTADADTGGRWNKAWGDGDSIQRSFGQFVTMLGGEFFFAPSRPFLEKLAP